MSSSKNSRQRSRTYAVFRRTATGALVLDYECGHFIPRAQLPPGWKCLRISTDLLPQGKVQPWEEKSIALTEMSRDELIAEVERLRSGKQYGGKVMRRKKAEQML